MRQIQEKPTEQQDVVYEEPTVVDYGTLIDLTQAGHHANSDVPFGTPNTAYVPGGPS